MNELPDLLTVGGVSALVLILVQVVIKPFLMRWLKLPPYGEESPIKTADFALWVNVIALLLGVLFGVGAEIAFNGVSTTALIVTAIVRGLFGGLGAIGGYEFIKNVGQAR
jgi:hypothetical protein